MSLIALLMAVGVATPAASYFHFAPGNGTAFVRTTTRTVRMEAAGLMRVESTVFRARFVVREASPGYVVTMTPLSFRYLVNDHEMPSEVWDLIRGHDMRLIFNVTGKLNEVLGYDAIDEAIKAGDRVEATPKFHFDHIPLGELERDEWERYGLLWLNQQASPGTKLEFDSQERAFTRVVVHSHTVMRVVRAKPCGGRACVVATYKMVPDLDDVRRRVNEEENEDYLDASSSEEIEQVIEPATMLLHSQRVTWKERMAAQTPESEQTRESSVTEVSEFAYEAQGSKSKPKSR